MFRIDEANNITLTRGDTAYIAFELTNGNGEPYELKEGDSVVLTVKENTRTKNALFTKSLADNQFKIVPTDTENLDYATYYYDVQLTTSIGDVFTVIPPSKFIVSQEVTW